MARKKKKKGGKLKYAIFTPFRPALRFLLKKKGIKTNRHTKTKELVEMFLKAYNIEIKNFEEIEGLEYYDESGERVTLSELANMENLSDDIILSAAKEIIKAVKNLIAKFKGDKNAEKELKELEDDDDIKKSKGKRKKGEEEESEKKGGAKTGWILAGIGGILLVAILVFALKK
jgi:multidrug efflux pump subunit AcrB